jgi:hypothetical protein
MSPLREGVILPALFLTVTLLGGLRIAVDGGGVRLLPPPLLALVLAMLLLGTLARGHVLVPAALLSASRRPLENLSGAIVLMTLFAASTQAINVVLPERGLLHAAVGVLLFVQLMTMTAGAAGRAGMLRSLLVLLGSLFVLRFVVFESLYAQEAGTLKRVLTALMAGVTLGGIEYEPNAAATGYVAFLTLALYVTGLVLMPAAVDGEVVDTALARAPSEPRLPRTLTIVCVATAIGASLTGCRRSSGPEPAAAGGEIAGPQRSSPSADRKPTWTPEHREGALRAARVWRQPAVPIAQADLGRNPPGAAAFTPDDVVECQLLLEPVGGTTPKFNCRLRDGTRVRVKYGDVNPEIFAEVAATRLLSALGFGADRMYVVRAIRCAGCPRDPFQALQCLARAGVEDACFRGGVDYERTVDIDPAVIERQVPGARIEAARAGSYRPGGRRLPALGGRRAAADGRPAGALGQQGGKPTADLPAWQRTAGRPLRRAARADPGSRGDVRSGEARHPQLAGDPDLGGCGIVPREHEEPALWRGHVPGPPDFGRGAPARLAPARRAFGAATGRSVHGGASHEPQGAGCRGAACPGVGGRV